MYLDGEWKLSLTPSPAPRDDPGSAADAAPDERISAPCTVPGDVHSALLAAGLVEEPYRRDNELAVDWVHRRAWRLEREFRTGATASGTRATLLLDGVDCVATVTLNGHVVGRLDNAFTRRALDVTGALREGANALVIDFDVAGRVAAERAERFPFELPYIDWNCRVPHVNHLRKTPCHAGWDWNIALMPVGVYGEVALVRHGPARLDDWKLTQRFDGARVTVAVEAAVEASEPVVLACSLGIGEARASREVALWPGTNAVALELELDDPERWWPVGLGAQTLHELELVVGDEVRRARVGLREVRLRRAPDADGPGSGFVLEVNGRALFARGANWIPADALPARITPAAVRELLQSALDANMNVLRIWGGGRYEPDWFHEMCDEMGLLVWQDFMFSCNHYPAADPAWLASVRVEARQQVRRLSRFASVALWCGDNELVGALDWWAVTREHRDRYLANYVRLSATLEEIVAREAPDVPFWPSSPSHGPLSYGDAWKNDSAGDMHFWDVWHEARPFEAYHEVRPRFCSEFGFQSFPSMPVVETFADPAERNVSSAVMAVHQRNPGGNARIVETLVRHFRFPDSFERTVYLSQVQQAMAITTAVEWWRSCKPHCMGTLYWQLNDAWPVASWSSLEYGGGWKLLHHAARRFHAPVMLALVPDRDDAGDGHPPAAIGAPGGAGTDARPAAALALRGVNDTLAPIAIEARLRTVDALEGRVRDERRHRAVLPTDRAVTLARLAPGDVPPGCFLLCDWFDERGAELGRTEHWPAPYKDFDLPAPRIEAVRGSDDRGEYVELASDAPAYRAALNLGGHEVWSDNGVTLLPGEPRRLRLLRRLTNPRAPVLEGLRIDHL